MKKEIIESIQILKNEKDILKSLDVVNGWYEKENYIRIAKCELSFFHQILENKYKEMALNLLSDKDKKSLETKFNHKNHFLEGVSKAHALYYYFASPDFDMDLDGRINGGVGKVTVAMKNYYNALRNIYRDIKNGIYLQDLLSFIYDYLHENNIVDEATTSKKDLNSVVMKKDLIKVCFQCEIEDIILDSGVCASCDAMNRKNDYLQNDGTIDITKDNIHLYYEFMGDEDLSGYRNILNNIFVLRIDKVLDNLKISVYNFWKVSKITTIDDGDEFTYYLSVSFFGIKDTLKPIDEYITEIKASSEYKAYIASK